MSDDPRLIERWLPIAALGEESVRERRSMTALPPTYYLHVWWARRPLVASRAAILGCPSPAMRGKDMKPIGASEWHKQPFVIASSQLMRREQRAEELLRADAWDIIVLDEAHHARRRGGGIGTDTRPNKLLRLMRALNERAQGLLLLTATPMQVHPVEIWDLLSLFGMPPEWTESAFLRFFNLVDQPNPSLESIDEMAVLFRSVEQSYGPVPDAEAARFCSGSVLKAKKILRALRDVASVPRRQLENKDRRAAITLMRANTPLRKLVSRHTRELLRKYYRDGKITTPIANRRVDDEFIHMTPREREIYDDVEDYISRCYNAASASEKTAVGFVMTIYRRRLASCFYALEQTLTGHLRSIIAGDGRQP